MRRSAPGTTTLPHGTLAPLIIIAEIPFSLVGIVPAHGLLNVFFTVTSMIDFIAGAGIVVRNSIILVDFIDLLLSEGVPLNETVIDAGAVRFRPMMLTAILSVESKKEEARMTVDRYLHMFAGAFVVLSSHSATG